MIDMRRHPTGFEPPKSHASIPDSQARALDRRHQLDQQQRAFSGNYAALGTLRTRPPS